MKSTWILVRKVSVEKDIMQLSRIYPLHPRNSCIRNTVQKKITTHDRKDRGKDLMQLTTAELHLGSGRDSIITTQLSSLRNSRQKGRRKEGSESWKFALPKINSPLKTSFIVTHDYSPFCISLLSRVSTFYYDVDSYKWVSACISFTWVILGL